MYIGSEQQLQLYRLDLKTLKEVKVTGSGSYSRREEPGETSHVQCAKAFGEMYIVYYLGMAEKITRRQLPSLEEATEFAKKTGERSTVMCCALVDANSYELCYPKTQNQTKYKHFIERIVQDGYLLS